ncbi:hypothetical protein KSP39_PZI022299 [Platanthera zijinensis]|uniref:Uncharacterized protein n=1 Tax=Platanthera zijinensis TaxID=2320716 RepID=A0AAP0FUK7_9ASPA
MDVKIEEEDQVLLQFSSLSNSFDHPVTMILHEKDTLKREEVMTILLSNETRSKSGYSTGECLLVKGNDLKFHSKEKEVENSYDSPAEVELDGSGNVDEHDDSSDSDVIYVVQPAEVEPYSIAREKAIREIRLPLSYVGLRVRTDVRKDCLSTRRFGGGDLYIQPEGIIRSRDEILELKKKLNVEFEMKDLGHTLKILGMMIKRDMEHGLL